MNDPSPDARLDALFAQARAHQADTSKAEYAFETRLLARLRMEHDTVSVWATVSWRLAPLFATCVVALAIWQSQVGTDMDDATAMASAETPESVDLWSNFD